MNERTNRAFSHSISLSISKSVSQSFRSLQYIRHHLWTYTVRTLNKEIEMREPRYTRYICQKLG